jgi:hypothetical protein
MLTDAEIAAVAPPNGVDVVLTNMAQIALRNLVFRSKEYKDNAGYYGDVFAQIQVVSTAAINSLGSGSVAEAMGQALGAVVNKMKTLPGVRVEDEGSQNAKVFFSSPDNWEELALDVLSTLYVPPGGVNSTQQYAFVVRNTMSDFPQDCGPRFRSEFTGIMGFRRWW